MRKILAIFFMIIFVLYSVTGCSTMDKVPVIVSAPASMSNVLLAISQQYEKLHPQVDIKLNFGSSGALKRQIEKGAAVDVFISAGKLEMDALSKQGRIDSDTIHNFAENELVLIRPAQTANPVRSLQDLNKNEVKRISIGEPNSVPAGRYAFQSLKHLRLWNDLQPKLVFAKDVRQVLTYVETKNVDAGIVYRTDALSSRKVAIVEQLDSASHEKILYCTGIVKNAAHHPEALQFQQYLLSKEAGYILVKNGFLPLRHQRW